MNDATSEIKSMPRSAALDLAKEFISDYTTILKFSRLVERYRLTAQLLATNNDVH